MRYLKCLLFTFFIFNLLAQSPCYLLDGYRNSTYQHILLINDEVVDFVGVEKDVSVSFYGPNISVPTFIRLNTNTGEVIKKSTLPEYSWFTQFSFNYLTQLNDGRVYTLPDYMACDVSWSSNLFEIDRTDYSLDSFASLTEYYPFVQSTKYFMVRDTPVFYQISPSWYKDEDRYWTSRLDFNYSIPEGFGEKLNDILIIRPFDQLFAIVAGKTHLHYHALYDWFDSDTLAYTPSPVLFLREWSEDSLITIHQNDYRIISIKDIFRQHKEDFPPIVNVTDKVILDAKVFDKKLIMLIEKSDGWQYLHYINPSKSINREIPLF